MIVGIITGSNQFVKLNEIVPDTREMILNYYQALTKLKLIKCLLIMMKIEI